MPKPVLVSRSPAAQRSDPRGVDPATSPLPPTSPLDPSQDPRPLMGAQPSQCCDGCGDRNMETAEEVEAHPWTEETPSKSTGQLPGSRMASNRPKHGRSLLDLLQGKWHRKEDGQPVGDISGTYIVWNPRWQFQEVISPISEDVSGAVVIDLEKQLHFGRPYFGPETLISWGDGDLWVKKSAVEPNEAVIRRP